MRVTIEIPDQFRSLLLGAISGELYGRDMPEGVELAITPGVTVSDLEIAGLRGLANWGLDRIRTAVQSRVYATYRSQLTTETNPIARRVVQQQARAEFEDQYASVAQQMSQVGSRVTIRVED